MEPSIYRRTPLPPAARPRLGWLALCLLALIASPFLGFAVHGRVAEPGLMIGLAIAVLPLAGLAALGLSQWRAMRRLPPGVAEEWRTGRVVPAVGAPAVAAPVRFSRQKDWIELRPEGLLLSRHTLLRLQGVARTMEKIWVSEQAGQLFVPWSDLAEWGVEQDNEGPDFHRLQLRGAGHLTVRRFPPVEGSEAELLDAVRSVGRLPIRLRCDVEDA